MTSLSTSVSTRPPRPNPLRAMIGRRLARDAALPVLPSAAAELMSLMSSDEASAKQLSDVIHRDQALAAHVLRVANTPAYRGVVVIVSLQQAVARLGMRLLSEIALSVCVQKNLFDVRGRSRLARQLWQRAYLTALIAKELARAQRHNVEAAFLCGLLHDVGAPAVLRAAVLAADAVNQSPSDEALTDIIDDLSPRVGLAIAERWELPQRVTVAIAHHRDFDGATSHRGDAACVAYARAMADYFLSDEEDDIELREHGALETLNLYDDEIDNLLAKREEINASLSAISP